MEFQLLSEHRYKVMQNNPKLMEVESRQAQNLLA